MKIIARIHSHFPEKFGIPRQSGLVEDLESYIIMEPEYRNPDAFRGIEDFSHIWLLWEFSENIRDTWSPTVRPPRLGGNKRVGVFATRSPFRPNPIGLSCVKLVKIEYDTELGPKLTVSGADLMDNTPIYDIKPYLPLSDCRPEALSGFAKDTENLNVEVKMDCEFPAEMDEKSRKALLAVLEEDPRPHYQEDPERIYGMAFDMWNVKFTVDSSVLYIKEFEKRNQNV